MNEYNLRDTLKTGKLEPLSSLMASRIYIHADKCADQSAHQVNANSSLTLETKEERLL